VVRIAYPVALSRYRRAFVPGGTFFFTVNLADRRSALLTERIDLLRAVYRKTLHDLPFVAVAIGVLHDKTWFGTAGVGLAAFELSPLRA
jgi:hypothetical protein